MYVFLALVAWPDYLEMGVTDAHLSRMPEATGVARRFYPWSGVRTLVFSRTTDR